MELSQILSYVITLLALVTSLIAWLTKLRLSKEYKEAKEAEIRALSAQMNIVREKVDLYESVISNKLLEHSKNTISQLEDLLSNAEKSQKEADAIKNILYEIAKSQKEIKLKYSDNENVPLALLLSHEIRTPINAIIGFSNLLVDENLNSENQKEYVEIINKSGDQLLSIIQDFTKILLGLQKIETGQNSFK